MISNNNSHLFLSIVLILVMVGATLAFIPTSAVKENKPDLTLETSDIHSAENEPEKGDESNNEADVDIVVKETRGENKTIIHGNTKRDSDGTNLSYVTVTLSRDPYNETIISDLAGWYEFEVDEGGTYRLYAEKTGYADYVAFIHVREGEENTTHIYMEREGEEKTKIYGYVWEKGTDNPIDNAKVTIWRDGHNESFTTYTNGDGYYAQELNSSGDYMVIAEKDGYKSDTKSRYIGEGEHIRIDLNLEKESTEDTILKGYTKDKSDSSNISNVFVEVSKGNYSQTTQSDENGSYEFDLEEGGTYAVRAEKEGYEDYSTNVSVQEGKETTHHIYMEKEGGSEKTEIYGYVTEKGTNNSIDNASVTIIKDGHHENYTTYTNSDGYYSQELNSGGDYMVTTEKDGYKSETKNTSIEDSEQKRLDFDLEKESTKDTILNVYTKRESDGANLSHVFIWLSRYPYNETTTSDANGWYEFVTDEGGQYHLHAEKTGYNDYDVWISLKEGEEQTFHIYMESESGSERTKIYGYVTEKETNNSIDNAEVTIWRVGHNESYTAYSLHTGYYDQELMVGGEFTITASKDGYVTQQKTVTILTAGVKQVDFILENVQDTKPPKEKYGVGVNASKTKLDLEGKNVTMVTITIKNIGEVNDSYTLTITGTYKGWTATMDSPDTISLQPGAMKSVSLTLNESHNESPEGDEIVVEVTAISQTYPEVQDSVRIEGKIEGDDSSIPDLTIPLVVASICAGALVAYFRHRY